MPIYEYQCRSCNHRLEKLQKLSDAPLKRCPECGQETLAKLVSAAGFRLKGGGWYETDFKTRGRRNVAGDGAADKPADSAGSGETGGKEGSAKADAPAKTAGASDSKPDAKAGAA